MNLRAKMNGKRGVLLKNTMMLYILQFSTYFLGFIVVPYETRVLGPVLYGMVGAAMAAMIYFQNVIDFGFILSGTADVALHRAFDVCSDPYETLEGAVDLGIRTILTSGQKNSAWEGRELLRELVRRSDGRIEILVGAGVSPETIEKLVPFTGAQAYHMSGKVTLESRMQFRRDGVSMGFPGFSEYEIWQTDADNIRRAVDVLEQF